MNSGIIFLWIAGITLLIAAFLWCRRVNEVLEYILGRLEKLDGKKGGGRLPADSISREDIIPPLLVVGIIGAAVLFLFIIPIWWINR